MDQKETILRLNKIGLSLLICTDLFHQLASQKPIIQLDSRSEKSFFSSFVILDFLHRSNLWIANLIHSEHLQNVASHENHTYNELVYLLRLQLFTLQGVPPEFHRSWKWAKKKETSYKQCIYFLSPLLHRAAKTRRIHPRSRHEVVLSTEKVVCFDVTELRLTVLQWRKILCNVDSWFAWNSTRAS